MARNDKQTILSILFGRLQADGVWEVEAEGPLTRRKSNSDPLKSELLRFQAAGGFPVAIYKELQTHPEIVRSIASELLSAHFPDSLHETIASAVGLDLNDVRRHIRRDASFRAAVLSAWGHQCAFCGALTP